MDTTPAAPAIVIALAIAGSDPSGGAGIQADLKTFAALGVYGAAVPTALTVQNTRGVTAVHHPPPSFLAAQLDAVLDDLAVRAVKIGMIGPAEFIPLLAERLRLRIRETGLPVVLDPVMSAKGGATLLRDDALDGLRRHLLPLALVLTPNLPEAAVLLGVEEAQVRADPEGACRGLLRLGPRSVVLKGGHDDGPQSVDLLYDGTACHRLTAPRHPTRNTHGTGCVFSSAIAAGLSRGLPVLAAVQQAKTFISAAIAAADRLSIVRGGCSGGQGPVHPLFAFW